MLQEVAAHGRLITDLRARRVQQRLGNDRELLHHARMGGHIRHRRAGAEPETLRTDFDAAIEQAG